MLDLSSNADHFGVGLALQAAGDPPSQTLVRGLSLVTLARDVRALTVPQIQWEPVWAIQNPSFPSPLVSADDGGATLLGIDTVNLVPIDPGHVVRNLVSEFQSQDPGITAAALFTLPFGMKAVAAPLRHPVPEAPLSQDVALNLVQPRNPELVGGLQVSLRAFNPLTTTESESPAFPGATIQLRNGIDPASGAYRGISVLADLVQNAVEGIFNAEFAPGSARARVPVTRIDFSGYGASLYSRWRNPAESAKTSQVYFDVAVGRTAHEVVQVRSVLYPWGVRVVRTITIERTSGGGVFRRDSGWVAESDGVFKFRARGVSTSIFVDYTDTRFTIALDSAASESWSYHQSGVAIVQRRSGLDAMTSKGVFRASSAEATRWTLLRQVFGDTFADAKNLMPLMKHGISSPAAGSPGGSIVVPPGNETVPLAMFKAEDAKLKSGGRLEFTIPEGIPIFIGRTEGGKVEIIFGFQKFFKLEVSLQFRILEIFPGNALFKYECAQLRREIGSSKVAAGFEEKLILAIGVGFDHTVVVVPFAFEWEFFLGIGFAQESRPDRARVGTAIIYQASGSVQCPPEIPIVEVGIKVEGQAFATERNGETVIVCIGSLSIEITVAFLLDIEWEIVEGEICSLNI